MLENLEKFIDNDITKEEALELYNLKGSKLMELFAVANKISEELGEIEIYDLSNSNVEKMNKYDKLILGGSTWGDGELNDDWDDIWDEFKSVNFSNKTVALFGLGDQESYSDEFCSAMGLIYEQINTFSDVNIIGFTSTQGYFHDASKAQIGNEFVGLVIDEDNQSDLTEERIKNWINKIKKDIL